MSLSLHYNSRLAKSFLPIQMFIYKPINARAPPVRYCGNAVRYNLYASPYASLCSCCTPQNGICGGYNPKKFLLSSLAVICVSPTLKIMAPPLASRTTGHVLGLGLEGQVLGLGLGLGKHVLGLDYFRLMCLVLCTLY